MMMGYLVILAMATGVSIYAVFELGRIKDVASSMVLVDNELIDLEEKLTDTLLSQTRYERKFVIVNDQSLVKGFISEQEEFRKMLERAGALVTDEQAESLIGAIRKAHDDYGTLFEEEIKYIHAGTGYLDLWFRDEMDKMINEIIDALNALKAESQGLLFRKVGAIGDAGTKARSVAISITAAAITLGIVISVFVARSIAAPLQVMKRKTRDIAQGIFEPDLKLQSPPEISELAMALNTMAVRLREVDSIKSDFFSLMSHELRTPLTSIKEGTNLMLEGLGGEPTEKQKRLLSIISEESNRLIGLVNSLLDLSKMEAGMLTYHFAPHDIASLIRQVVKEVEPLAESRKIMVTMDLVEMPRLPIDAERILQMLRNLLGNALKFTPDGGTVSIKSYSLNDEISVKVSDTGPGIPSKYVADIFEKYTQVRRGTERLKGTGLGLALVKHIVTAHGGRVWLESESGKGSSFYFALPR